MMLTGRNEWIAIAALILYIAFVPCPYEMKQFFASPIGKVVALGTVIYVWKYVSCPVAILLLVAFLRSGSLREYLESETGMTPPPSSTDYKCPDEFMYSADKKMCTKGTETATPMCNDATMTWDATEGKCKSSSAGGPAGGTTPGAMAAKNEMANSTTTGQATTVESFTPYSKEKAGGEFAPA